MMANYRLRHCTLRSGTTMTAEDALRLREAEGRWKCRDMFFCPACGGRLVVHATNPAHFEHARDAPDCADRFVR